MTRRVRGRVVVEAEPAFRTRHANPYNARLYDAMDRRAVEVRDLSWLRLLLTHVDVVHLHWPSLTFLSGHRRSLTVARLTLFFGILAISRYRGTRMIWTAHNVDDHERRSTPGLRRAHRRLLTDSVDAVIVLTESGAQTLRRAFPELEAVPVHVVPHGHYRDDYDFALDRDAVRAEMELHHDAPVLVSVGQIRPYKAVPTLVRTFRNIDDERAVLVVAGRPSNAELAQEIREAADGDGRIRLALEFQSDLELARLLIASDLVVLSYAAVQNSGSAILALSAHRPVLAPAIGALPELQRLVGEEWVRLYDGELTGEHLAEAVARARVRPIGGPDLDAFDWTTIAGQTEAVYRSTLRAPRPRARSVHRRSSRSSDDQSL